MTITRIVANRCTDWDKFSFDISKTAAAYAGMAGVLTGFAFVAMTNVLNRADRRQHDSNVSNKHERDLSNDPDRDRQTVVALLCAFIGLVMTTIQYAILAGESGCALVQGRAASEELVGAVALAASVYILIYALVDLVAENATRLNKEFRRITAVILPPIMVLYVTDVLTDLAVAMGYPGDRSEPTWTLALLAGFSLAIATWLACLCLWRRSKLPRKSSKILFRTVNGPPYGMLALVFTTTVMSALMPNSRPDAKLPLAVAWAYVFALPLLLLYASANLSRAASVGSGLSNRHLAVGVPADGRPGVAPDLRSTPTAEEHSET